MPGLLEVKHLTYLKPREAASPETFEAPPSLLHDLSFTVPVGGIFAIVGPSGSGKSTLLKCLCRLEEATSGEILFQGDSIQALDPRTLRRKMPLVFQVPVLMGPTVADDLQTGFRWQADKKQKSSAFRETALRLLQRVHLEERFLGENPKNLSVGEAQRVALARALAIEPEALLLDEPTASLDAESKTQIERCISELGQSGVTVLLVSHDASQIDKLSSHGIELAGGRMKRFW